MACFAVNPDWNEEKNHIILCPSTGESFSGTLDAGA
jgi:hypothetical protein